MASHGTPPDVSVLITTFRRERLVLEAIASAKAQEGIATEIIVMDDSPEGSARDGVTALEGVTFVHCRSPSGGFPSRVRNDAAQLASAPLLYFLDDDDRLAAGALRALAQALRSSGAGMAFGRIKPFGTEPELAEQTAYFKRVGDVARGIKGGRSFAAQLMFGDSLLVNSACMVRRDVFQAVGGYDSSIRYCEDVELYVRVGRQYGVSFVDMDVLHYRVGSPSVMYDVRAGRDASPTHQTYRTIARRYKEKHGVLEYRLLQAWARIVDRVS